MSPDRDRFTHFENGIGRMKKPPPPPPHQPKSSSLSSSTSKSSAAASAPPTWRIGASKEDICPIHHVPAASSSLYSSSLGYGYKDINKQGNKPSARIKQNINDIIAGQRHPTCTGSHRSGGRQAATTGMTMAAFEISRLAQTNCEYTQFFSSGTP